MDKIAYIKNLKKYLLFSVILFAVSFVEGYYLPQNYPNEAKQIVANFKDSFGPVVEAGGAQMFIFIFLKNITALFFAAFLGIFGGIIPVLSIFSNGFLIGLVGFYAIEKISWTVFVLALAPHGIFELPAFFLGASVGMKLGAAALRKIYYFLRQKPVGNIKSFREELSLAARFFVSVLVPLLFIAALMETYVTPLLIPVNSRL